LALPKSRKERLEAFPQGSGKKESSHLKVSRTYLGGTFLTAKVTRLKKKQSQFPESRIQVRNLKHDLAMTYTKTRSTVQEVLTLLVLALSKYIALVRAR